MEAPLKDAAATGSWRRAARSPRWVWLAAALAAAFCLLYVASLQLGPLRQQALQEDELYFGACAARSQVEGWAAVAGCHDNKAPLIYLVHATLQQFAAPYDAVSLKLASALLFAAIAAMAYRLACRAAPAQSKGAGMAAVILLVCALVPAPSLLAIKTELLGTALLLLALLLCPVADQPPRWTRCLAIGFAFGAAVMSKQTFAVMLPAVLWMALRHTQGTPLRAHVRPLAAIALGSLLPLLMLAGLYAASGKLQEFLATTFLYPAVYGAANPAAWAKRAAWRFATISEFLQLTPIHFVLALAAWAGLSRRDMASRAQQALAVGAALGLLIMVVAPILFKYHTIPFWVLACPLGGAMIARAEAAGGLARTYALGALLGAAILASGMTLLKNGGEARVQAQAEGMSPTAGRYAYVLGMEPQLYARGFIPASSVQFPWALPGTPATWAYRPPAPGSATFERLQAQQQRNLAQLYADFERTPPAYIAVFSAYAQAPGSANRYTDVPGFDDYLQRHCQPVGTAADTRNNPGTLFACNAAR